MAVATALRELDNEVSVLDSSDTDEKIINCEVIFPVLHGVGGEDGTFQLRLENLGVPFVGSGSESSKICMDKSTYREFMIHRGFLMPHGEIVDESSYFNNSLKSQPHVLKPIDGGSSVDTHILRQVDNRNDDLIRQSFQRHPRMLLEELIVGVEVTVGILGNQALPVIEIIPPEDGDFDFENKYNGKTQELIPPPHVNPETQCSVQELALSVHQAAGCRDFSRSDFIITHDQKCYLLETNTIPGMTNQSLFPKAAQAAGYSMHDCTSMLVALAHLRQ